VVLAMRWEGWKTCIRAAAGVLVVWRTWSYEAAGRWSRSRRCMNRWKMLKVLHERDRVVIPCSALSIVLISLRNSPRLCSRILRWVLALSTPLEKSVAFTLYWRWNYICHFSRCPTIDFSQKYYRFKNFHVEISASKANFSKWMTVNLFYWVWGVASCSSF
jgi:hypothetical protein